MKVICRCEHCDAAYSIVEEKLGNRMRCAKCRKETTLKRSEKDTHVSAGGGDTVVPRPSKATAASKRIGRFELRQSLGAGGFGTVYRAYDPLLDREVALKVPHAGRFEAGEDRQRVLNEAKAAAKLHHPNIVTVYEAGMDGDRAFILSEFIEGQTLQRVAQEGQLDFRRAARIVMDLADGLDYAHRSGIVHRDVKPANVMLDAQDAPLLMDFGLARSQQSTERRPQDGTLEGTLAYMSPEQAKGAHGTVGPPSDQYSLGVVLYELLCGRRPFQGASQAMPSLIIHRDPPRPRTVNPQIPRDLEAICLRAMAKMYPERYASCGGVASDLRRWLEGEPVRTRPVGPAERFWRWCRRNPVIAGLSTAVAAVLILGIIVSTLLGMETSRQARVALREKEQAATERDRAEEAQRSAEEQTKRAEKEGKRAEAARGRAEKAQEKAEEEKDRAETERRRAEEQKKLADEQRKLADEQRNRAERNLSYSRLALAEAKSSSGDLIEAERTLDSCSEEHRHWEWGYLKRLCHVDVVRILGHNHGVNSVAFSPDGKRVFSGGLDEVPLPSGQLGRGSSEPSVKVWDATTGQETPFLQHPTDGSSCLAFSPDGRRLLGAGENVYLWDAATGQRIWGRRNPDPGDYGVRSAAFSPDGKWIALGVMNPGLYIWDATTAQEVHSFAGGHQGGDQSLVFSPDGKRIASCGMDNMIKVRNATTGKEISTLQGHTGKVNSVAFSPDGKWIASGGGAQGSETFDSTVRLWDARRGLEIRTLYGHADAVASVAFSPDGKWIVSGSCDSSVKVWEAATGQEMFTLRGHTQRITDVTFSSDGKRIVSGSSDGTIRVWAPPTREPAVTLLGHAKRVHCVAFSPNGRYIASGGDDGALKVWNCASVEETLNLKGHTHAVVSVAFNPDGSQIVSRGTDELVKVWDAATGHEIRTLRCAQWSRDYTAPMRRANSVAFSPDGKLIASSGASTELWDANTGQKIATLPEGGTCLSFSPDGERIVVTGPILRMWDVATGREALTLKGATGLSYNVSFSPDGRRIASATDGIDHKAVTVWDAATGQETLTLEGHTDLIHSVAFSPDGQRIVSCGSDKTLKVWGATMGQEILTLRGHTQRVTSVSFSPDGSRIVSGSYDGTVKIWDGTIGQ